MTTRDLAGEVYDKLQPGETGWIRPDTSKGDTLHSFQAVALAADSMQRDGLIMIRCIHKESTSGDNAIDAIQFTKVK